VRHYQKYQGQSDNLFFFWDDYSAMNQTLSKIFNRQFSAYIGICRRISGFIGATGFQKMNPWYDLTL